MAFLKVEDLQVYYGAINAIKGISFEVEKGEVIALIGANGAGKTTILHTITGLVPAKTGTIQFCDKELTKTPAHKIVSMGMAHVPEGRRIFQNLTVFDNLMMGAFTRKDKKEIEDSLANVFKRFPRLDERRTQIAGTLSGGEQQMLAMGRALMSKPSIILMDEPSMGLSPLYVNEIFDIIKEINASWTSPPWAWLPFWLTRFLTSSRLSTTTAPPFCWLSRTRRRRFPLPTGRMFWKRVKSCFRATPRSL